MENLAPIALFVYNRLAHTQRAIESLRNNYLSKESELFIFSDGSKNELDKDNVLKVREYVKNIRGFKRVTIIEREVNFGLSRSIISGVNELVLKYDKVIVLEDDLVTARFFLQFMNKALVEYQDEERVISVCGYMFPLSGKYSDVLFFRVADCWGWATWKRGWKLFSSDGKQLYASIKKRDLFYKFNIDGAINYERMLIRQFQGKNDSWAIRWYASAFLSDKLSVYPWKSLVINTGFDQSGTHCGAVNCYETSITNESVNVPKLLPAENKDVLREIRRHLIKQKPGVFKKILAILSKKGYNLSSALSGL